MYFQTFVNERSAAQDEPTSRLPSFNESEKLEIAGTSDFFGINHYTTVLTYDHFNPDEISTVGYYQDREANTEQDFTWPSAASDWLKEVCLYVGVRAFCFIISRTFFSFLIS